MPAGAWQTSGPNSGTTFSRWPKISADAAARLFHALPALLGRLDQLVHGDVGDRRVPVLDPDRMQRNVLNFPVGSLGRDLAPAVLSAGHELAIFTRPS